MNRYDSLYLPALRAQMGDRVYYISFMNMKDVHERVFIAQELHRSKNLNELIQRRLSKRAPEIQDYLLQQIQRFFGAFVIGVYGGQPKWVELDVERRPHIVLDDEKLKKLNGAMGILILDGREKLFAIDGQHRVAGIRQTLIHSEETGKHSEEIGKEEVTTIFVSHSNDEQGLSRTRRLFTTLNRYAKPLNKMDAIALDEDDAVAITTRNIVDNHPLFCDRINLSQGKNIPSSDKKSITTIISLYDALDFYLKNSSSIQWNLFKRIRPSEEKLQKMHNRSDRLWDHLSNHFSVLSKYSNSKLDEPAALYRHNDGGHLLFRPIGFMMIIKVMKLLEDQNVSTQEAARRIGQVPMELKENPWNGLLWNQHNKRMITVKDNQNVATALLLHGAGGQLTSLNTSAEKLKEELTGLLNTPSEGVAIKQYV